MRAAVSSEGKKPSPDPLRRTLDTDLGREWPSSASVGAAAAASTPVSVGSAMRSSPEQKAILAHARALGKIVFAAADGGAKGPLAQSEAKSRVVHSAAAVNVSCPSYGQCELPLDDNPHCLRGEESLSALDVKSMLRPLRGATEGGEGGEIVHLDLMESSASPSLD